MTLSISERSRIKSKYGPWAVITGASSGIGKELATRLAEADLNVVLVARREDLLNRLATDLEAAYDIETRIVVADLSRPDQMQEVLNATADLDVGLLIAAAGFGTSGSFLEANLEEELSMLRVNCEALFRQTYHFALRFANRGNGGIILLSSMVGFQGVPYAAHYAATKAYVQSLGEALSVELKPLGVDVLAAAPGPVESGFGERADMQMNMALRPTDVGVPILKALGRKSTVLPGWLTKLLVGALRTVPRWGKVRIMKLVMGGMTEHQKGREEN